MAFVDYSLAFDSIKHQYICKALENCGIENIYVNILKEIYRNNHAYITLEKNGRHFKVAKGVKQGCPM